jgi:hypothetical protein
VSPGRLAGLVAVHSASPPGEKGDGDALTLDIFSLSSSPKFFIRIHLLTILSDTSMEEIPATHPEELTQSSPPKFEPHDDVANADITNDSEAGPIASTGSSGAESRSKLVDTSEDTTGPKATLAEPEPAPSVPDNTSAPKQRREWPLIIDEFQILRDPWIETQHSSENIGTCFREFIPTGSHDLYIVYSDDSRFVAKNMQGDRMLELMHDIWDIPDIGAAIV